MEKRTPLLAAFAALSLALPVSSFAQGRDDETKALIAKAAAAYRSMSAFSATVETTQGAGASATKITSKIVVKKPNLVNATVIRMGETKHVVADGKFYYADSSSDAKKYIKAPAADLKSALNAVAMNGGTGVGLLPILLTSDKAEDQMIPGKPVSVKKVADVKVDGTDCDTVQAVINGGGREFRYTFAFGKQDHLLRKLTVGPNTDGADLMVSETYSAVTLSPSATDATFAYKPAPGAVAADPPKAPAMFDERLKVGAEPFPLKGTTLEGKKISYADYKGKVLLVDFWATWCGPCVAELPNVLDAYKKYHAKGFDILGISLDREDRSKLESFIKERKMDWPQIYDGKFWQAENAVAYGVRSIPFTLLIGKDGKIAAVGARGEALAPAIETALAK
jgi:outer membrane lipoprotein-sorting protein/peroxiredoxin